MTKDEREQIREKRSSLFKGPRRGSGIVSKEIIIGAIFLIVLSLVFVAPGFWTATNNTTALPAGKQINTDLTPPGETSSSKGKTVSPTSTTPPTPKTTPQIKSSPAGTPTIIFTGKIGVPLAGNGFEITVKSISLSSIHTSVWILVRNTGTTEKPLKLNPKPAIIDDSGNQYENLIVERSGLNQSNLYPKAKREGAVFFDRFKEGTKAETLILYINEARFDFALNDKNNS
ncbi:MAG: hypothetical protein OIN87_07815 [Candidatus Methanoperedens sp.]|nr:hypothetical protein [Candidatus Methanoperedens sp.]